ncbi:RecQ family ATP-dependent DNA helicase [Puniceicoccus vermicola]|uniref:ATP-dependent DNA helicase RecQ n=1 Tax=Puniceicoccus vermicola TaxID=388746 RepID=A0A7X1AVW8_9BACT|nr:RecQ family ATP-dependent DNA helicase [Puniceicoccus vermicola]MBC2600946.1 RecQ family ATP-dependent DNA helicase [Puniceicoccus vermicola]
MSDANDSLSLLRERFGFEEFRPGQQEVIDRLLAGKGAAAIFPTGSGKSLCYQLPSLLLPGLTLVISPLLALMKDQIDSLRAKGVRAERLDSSLDEEDYRRVTAEIRAGEVGLLFVAPERLGNERFLSLIRGQRISLLAVDEAHCISAWGHNFRPDYLKLADAAKSLEVERVLALTATATPKVSADMAAAFGIAPEDIINTGFYRANLELRVTACADEVRPDLLLQRLRDRPAGATIVYVSLQRHAEEVAASLKEAGFNAEPYHAGMAAEKRSSTQEAFMRGDVQIICATIAFGMGIDKADIRYIYHYHLAKGFESYMQEIGRAGRDGKPSVCELFACGDDVTTLENFVYGDTPDPVNLENLLGELLMQGPSIDLAVTDLARRFDMRPLVISTLLTRLELAGVIRSEGHYYGSVRFAPKVDSQAMLGEYSEGQASFLRKLFACCAKAKKWVTLDMDRAVEATGQDRAVVLRALESLQTKGLADLQLAGYRQRFQLLAEEPDPALLAEELAASFETHERMEIERIGLMLEYAEEPGCLTAMLLEYFGESIADCGHCGNCLGDTPEPIPPRRSPGIESLALDGFEDLVAAHPEALGRPRQQARFLCGLSSPAVSAVRGLRGNAWFGKCAEVPFAEVLAARS